jgi:hypothetical protein
VRRTWQEAGRRAQTVRSYYYALLGGYLKPDEKAKGSARMAYQWVSRLLTTARENGTLDWRAVEDAGHLSRSAWFSASLESHINGLGRSSFSLDTWLGQPKRIIVWTEKDGELSNLWAICEPYRVPVEAMGGFGSTSSVHDAAEEYGTGEGVLVLYVGDADPSGFDMQRDLLDQLRRYGCTHITVRRVYVTDEQTANLKFDAEQDLKNSDSRIKRFRLEHPTLEHGYEMQAVSARDQERLLNEAIEREMDMDAFREAIRLEREISTWLTMRLQKHIPQLHLDRFILREQVIVDPATGEPFAQEVLDRYLRPVDTDDEG